MESRPMEFTVLKPECDDDLLKKVDLQVKRIKQARRQKHTVLAHTSYIGVLGLVLVLPMVGGAYLGRWLDSMDTGFTISWTISLILVGVVVGALNVYFLIKERG